MKSHLPSPADRKLAPTGVPKAELSRGSQGLEENGSFLGKLPWKAMGDIFCIGHISSDPSN